MIYISSESSLMSLLIICARLYPFLHISAFPFTLRAHLAALHIQISHHSYSQATLQADLYLTPSTSYAFTSSVAMAGFG